MSLYDIEHKALTTLSSIADALDTFSRHIENQKLPAWVYLPSGAIKGSDARNSAAHIYRQTNYLEKQDGRETLILPGVIMTDTSTIAMAHNINALKDEFKKACLHIKRHSEDDDRVRKMLNENGFARLNIKHIYRRIPIIDPTPRKVGFTWASTRSMTRISAQEALSRLEKITQSEHTLKQIEAAKNLPKNEELVVIQALSSHLKANVTWHIQRLLKRRLINTPLPILISSDGDMPTCVEPREAGTRKRRGDIKTEPFAYLPAIRAYRYLPEYRQLKPVDVD